jgi:hypothetical protein
MMPGASMGLQKDAILVGVSTTSNRGHTPEELADMCADKLVSVADTAPREIRDQARAFKDQLRVVVLGYLKQAVLSDRTTVYNTLTTAGHSSLADMIRRL